MNDNGWLMIGLAFIAGYFFRDMMKNMCGNRLVEGASYTMVNKLCDSETVGKGVDPNTYCRKGGDRGPPGYKIGCHGLGGSKTCQFAES